MRPSWICLIVLGLVFAFGGHFASAEDGTAVEEPPVKPAPSKAVANEAIVGAWTFDLEYMKSKLRETFEAQIEELPEAAREAASQSIDAELAKIDSKKFALVISGDGTYSATHSDAATGESETSRGTWQPKGEGAYTIQQTHEDGKVKSDDPFEATMRNGAMYAKPDADMPFAIKLVRQQEDIVGTWNIDIEHLKVAFAKALEARFKETPEASRKQAVDVFLKSLDSAKFTLVLNSDSTYSGISVAPGETKTETTKGTWKANGKGGYTLQQTHENGQPKPDDAVDVEVRQGAMYRKPDTKLPFEVRLVRE